MGFRFLFAAALCAGFAGPAMAGQGKSADGTVVTVTPGVELDRLPVNVARIGKQLRQTEVREERDRTSGAQSNKPIEDIRADDEHVIWPFVGEYWRDELGYYRVKIRNKCQKNAPEGAPSTGETPAPAEGAPAGGEGGGAPAEGGGAPTP